MKTKLYFLNKFQIEHSGKWCLVWAIQKGYDNPVVKTVIVPTVEMADAREAKILQKYNSVKN